MTDTYFAQGLKKKKFKKSQHAQQMECFKHSRKKTILRVIERICQENVITVEVMKKADKKCMQDF